MVLDAQRMRAAQRGSGGGIFARLTTETKHAFKTTEFWSFVAVVAGILITAQMIDDGDGGTAGGDTFPAQRAWLYIAIVAAAYMVSRGLAKAGSREPYWAGQDDLPGGRDRDNDNDNDS